jgi:hypothetical protein
MLRSGRQHVFRAVDMAAEGHPLLGQLAQVGKAHHLEPAGVGQDRPLPVHEGVQPPEPRDPLGRGAQHQVVGVAQKDVGAGRPHAFGQHRLDRSGRAHRHEGGRAHLAARRADHAARALPSVASTVNSNLSPILPPVLPRPPRYTTDPGRNSRTEFPRGPCHWTLPPQFLISSVDYGAMP